MYLVFVSLTTPFLALSSSNPWDFLSDSVCSLLFLVSSFLSTPQRKLMRGPGQAGCLRPSGCQPHPQPPGRRGLEVGVWTQGGLLPGWRSGFGHGGLLPHTGSLSSRVEFFMAPMLSMWNTLTTTFNVFVYYFNTCFSPEWVSIDSFFLLHVGFVFLLLCLCSNFLVDDRHCEFYLVG